MKIHPSLGKLLSLGFVLLIAIGGFFRPEFGLALAGLMIAAVFMTLRKPRSFCSAACPRGRALGFALKPFSRGRPVPAPLRDPGFRRLLCGLMFFCVIGSLARGSGSAEAVGRVFWLLCIVSLTGGLILGLLYKPRAWCAVCPLGTLQDTIAEAAKGRRRAEPPASRP